MVGVRVNSKALISPAYRSSCNLGYRWVQKEHRRQNGTCAPPEDRHLVLVPSECSNILLDPFQRRQLVPNGEIEYASRCSFCSLGETERPQTIAEIDINNGRSSLYTVGNEGAAIKRRCGTRLIAATVCPASKHCQ